MTEELREKLQYILMHDAFYSITKKPFGTEYYIKTTLETFAGELPIVIAHAWSMMQP